MIGKSFIRPILYGRRKGHKLRRGQARLVEQRLPDLRILAYAQTPLQCFDFTPQKLALEIGFGGGEHLAACAARAPDEAFIGCEPFYNGVAKLVRAIETYGLKNIRIHDGDACELMTLLPAQCLDKIWLLHPDPWPKRRHHKRRFINPHNLNLLFRLLKPQAHFIMASDVPDYIDWSLHHIRAHGGFMQLAPDSDKMPASDNKCHSPPAPVSHDNATQGNATHDNAAHDTILRSQITTRYEAKALRQGRVPTRLVFIRRKTALPGQL